MKRHAHPVTSPTSPQPSKSHALLLWLQKGWHFLTLWMMPLALFLLFLPQLPLLQKLGERAICYADWVGFMEAASRPVPGGVLQWCGDFCAVLFHWPWLGAGVFAILCGATYALGRFWVRLSPLIAFVPIIQVLLHVVYCGFSVWVFANAAFPQCYLLEWMVTLFCLGAVKRFGAWGVLSALLYPWVGITALIGLLGASVLPRRHLYERLLCLAIPFIWVIGWKMGCYADPSWFNLLGTQHWLLFEADAVAWDILASIAVLIVLSDAYIAPWSKTIGMRWAWTRKATPLIVMHLVIALTLLFADPRSIYDILKCERNLRHGDGQAALALPEEAVIGHRMLSAYYIHGLWRAGTLEEKLFDMRWVVSHQSSTIDTMSLDGYWLLYHYGIVQMARRWCYENVIKLGWSADNYALLTKIAIVCNEMPLAKRYAQQLHRIPLRQAEAEEYLAYIAGNPIPKNHELWRIADLHLRLTADPGSPTFEAGKKLEEGIYNRYAVLKNGNRDMVALYLCSSLLLQDTTAITENFDVILNVWPQRPLPRVFQQALLEAAATLPPEKQPRLTTNLFTPGMVEAFQAFQKLAPNADPTDPKFRKRFGNSYWYYASFLQ